MDTRYQRVFHCGATYHHHDSVGLLLSFYGEYLAGHVDSYFAVLVALAWRHSFFCRFCVPVAIA